MAGWGSMTPDDCKILDIVVLAKSTVTLHDVELYSGLFLAFNSTRDILNWNPA
jgi:hypothetical protein